MSKGFKTPLRYLPLKSTYVLDDWYDKTEPGGFIREEEPQESDHYDSGGSRTNLENTHLD